MPGFSCWLAYQENFLNGYAEKKYAPVFSHVNTTLRRFLDLDFHPARVPLRKVLWLDFTSTPLNSLERISQKVKHYFFPTPIFWYALTNLFITL